MEEYFERLEKIIEKHEREIDHLNSERRALRNEENNMSFNEFNREYQTIINYLENERNSLKEAQDALDSYRTNYNKAMVIIEDLKMLRQELEGASNSFEENNINADIRKRQNELETILDKLPLELADYVRSLSSSRQEATKKNSAEVGSKVNESEVEKAQSQQQPTLPQQPQPQLPVQQPQLQEIKQPQQQEQQTLSKEVQDEYNKVLSDIENLKTEIARNEANLKDSIKHIQDIISEERNVFEQEGPFNNERLNSLQIYYMGLKISENENYLDIKKTQKRLNRKLQNLNKKLQQINEINAMANSFDITYEEMKSLTNILKNSKVIKDILRQRGLSEIISKRSKTKEEKALLNEALNEIRNEIIAYTKEKKDVSIKEAINVLYGMDQKVALKQEAKSTKMPVKDFLAITNNVMQYPAVIRNNNSVQNTPAKLAQSKVENNHLEEKVAFPLLENLTPNPLLAIEDKNPNTNPILALEDKSLKTKTPMIPIIEKEPKKKEIEEKTKVQPPSDDSPRVVQPIETQNPNNANRRVPVAPKTVNESPREVAKAPLKRGLREIFGDLRKDLVIGKKDGKRYQRSNLKVSKNFKEELSSGNVLYNITHIIPAVIKAQTQLLSKISGKLLLSSEAKSMIKTLESRVDNLSVDDLETIYKEYRGNRINQERYPLAFNMVIESKMSEYILGKVTKINENIEKNYRDVIYAANLLNSIDENLRKGKISNEEKINKLEQRKQVFSRAADSIKYIRKAKIEADNLLSGGLHGLTEDMKAAATKLNCVGMRFAKDHDMDQELEDALMNCEKKENKAIYDNDDEALLKAFMESEVLLNDNTIIDNSIAGYRSVGKKYYSPLAEQLDYRNDPFMRDLFSTIAVSMAAINVVNTVKSHNNEAALSDRDFYNQVYESGKKIADKQGVMYKGMQAQANQDVLSASGTIERTVLDKTGWGLGTDAYHAADQAGHQFYNSMYDNLQNRFAEITNSYNNGLINRQGVFEELAQASNDAHATLVNVADKCLEVIKPYAQANPQFDLGAFQNTMQFLVDNPDAISNMNQAMVEVQDIAQNLVTLSNEQLATISNLPNNLGQNLLAAASTCALAQKVATTMEKKKNKYYGNKVTDMIDDYAYELEEQESRSR